MAATLKSPAELAAAAFALPVGVATAPVVVVGAEEVGATGEVEGETTGDDDTDAVVVEVAGAELEDEVTGPVLSE